MLIEAEKPTEVRIVRDYDPSLPPIEIDRNQLIQALLNIVRNALNAVEDDGLITIRTRALHNRQSWPAVAQARAVHRV